MDLSTGYNMYFVDKENNEHGRELSIALILAVIAAAYLIVTAF